MSLPFCRGQLAYVETADARLLLAAPYSSTGRSSLFALSLPDATAEKFPLHDTAAPAIVAGPDQRAYLGTASGRILRFDAAAQRFDEIGYAPRGHACTVGVSHGSLIFIGTSGGAVLEIDPASGSVECILSPAASSAPVHSLLPLPDGHVLALLDRTAMRIQPGVDEREMIEVAGLPAGMRIDGAATLDADTLLVAAGHGRRILHIETASLRVADELVSLPDDDAVYCLQVIGGHPVAGGHSGALYGWTGEAWERLGTPIPYDPLNFIALPGKRIAGVTYQGRLVQVSEDWRRYAIAAVPNSEPDGMDICALGVGPDRKLYFAPAANMRVGCWDPEEDEVSMRFVAAPAVGEVSALGHAGERLLLGFAPDCGVMTFYPDLPYRLLENPKLLDYTGTGPCRPIGPMVHHGTHVYFATAGDDAGALVRLDPIHNKLLFFTDIIPGQRLTSLVVDRANNLLVAGGGQGQVALWSPQEERTVAMLSPFADAPAVTAWAAESGRLYVTDGGTRYAIFSAPDGGILQADEFPLGVITSLITTQHGELYGLAGGWLFFLDAEHRRIECQAEATGSLLTEVRYGLLAFTHQGRIFTARIR